MVETTTDFASDCPDFATLADYASGSLTGDAFRQVRDHLAVCPACRSTVQDLAGDEELTTLLRNAVGLEPEVTLRRRLEAETDGAYDILETIGHGAGGVVFKARDLKLDRIVAIKCLWTSGRPDSLAAAFVEARRLATINHPNIAAIYALSEKPDIPFFVMEFVDGLPITDALAHQPVSRQVQAFAGVLRAVAELHRRGLVHRDLKPANVLVDRQNNVKLVDFGIACPAEPGRPARAEGTPAYLAPEQGEGAPAHPAADVFSLGIILFELLTGQRPFHAPSPAQLVAAIRQSDPPLPRSLREEIPGALQAITLVALEKSPALRYPSAQEFLLDVERFLDGEAVSANPTLLASVLDHGIDRHIVDLERWKNDRMISVRECDYLLNKYSRLREREDFWVLDSRRISFSQVMLHLGAWSCAVSAFLMLAFPWPQLGTARVILPSALLALLLAAGLILWKRRTPRVSIVLLMGAAITGPIAVATALTSFGLLPGADAPGSILPGILGNTQLLIATLAGLALSAALWWHTRTAAFAMIWSVNAVVAATAAFALHGLRQQLVDGHLDTVGVWYLSPGLLMLVLAIAWDLRWRVPAFAAPFYGAALLILLISLTLIAQFGPTLHWLGAARAEPGPDLTRQIEYSYIINGILFLLAGLAADRSTRSSWLRWIATILFWLAPSHLLIPILRLESRWPIAATGWTLPELLLPAIALAFVFASVPRQMKSFFFSGLFYIAIAVQRLTARHFIDRFSWPLALAAAGLLLVLAAWRWPALFDRRQTRVNARTGPPARPR